MILTQFCEKWKVVSSVFSIMKNIATSFFSSSTIKLTCCFKSGFSYLICLLKSFAITKAKFSVLWRRKWKSCLIICSALFKCVFDISLSLSAKEKK